MLQPRTVLRYLRTMIPRRDLLSIANWHSLQHPPITSSRFPSGHPAHRYYETPLLEFSQKTTSTQYLVPLQSSPSAPPFSFAKCVTVAVSSPLDTPLHPGSGGQPETGAGGRVALQAVESFTKVPKKKRNFTLMDPQMVGMFRNNIQFCQFRRSMILSHTDDACFPWTNHMCSSAAWSA